MQDLTDLQPVRYRPQQIPDLSGLSILLHFFRFGYGLDIAQFSEIVSGQDEALANVLWKRIHTNSFFLIGLATSRIHRLGLLAPVPAHSGDQIDPIGVDLPLIVEDLFVDVHAYDLRQDEVASASFCTQGNDFAYRAFKLYRRFGYSWWSDLF